MRMDAKKIEVTHADIYRDSGILSVRVKINKNIRECCLSAWTGTLNVEEAVTLLCEDNWVNPTNKEFVIEVLEWYLKEEIYSKPDSAIKKIPYKEICIFGWKPCGEGGVIRKITEIIGYNTYCDCCINMRHIIVGGVIALPMGILIGILL